MKFRHLPVVILVTLTLIGIAPLAAQDNATEYPVTVIDATGAEVTVDARPERVMCLFTDCIQNLAVLDVLPAGAFEFDKRVSSSPGTFGDRAEEITAFAWGDAGPDAEALLDFAPDFFVMEGAAFSYAPQLEVFTETTTVYFSSGPYVDRTQSDINDPEVWEDFTADLRNFGVIFDRQEQANAFIERLQNRIEAYSQIVNPDARYARVRLEADMSIFAPPCMGLMRGMATCVSFGDEWIQTTVEALLDFDPDVIIVEDSPDREIDLDAWAEVPLWSELSAVQNDRVFIVPYDSFYDATPLSLSNTMDAILPLLNPDVLPDGPLTDAQVQEILSGENANAAADNFPVTVVDGLEREITFETVPERVVLLTYAPIADFAALGIVPVGVTAPWGYQLALEPINFGEAAESFVQVPYGENTVEVVAGLEPDLVIIDSPEFLEALESFTTVYVEIAGGQNLPSVDAYADNVRDYGLIFNKQAEAEALIESVGQRIDAYAQLSPGDRSISVLYFADDGTVWFPPDCGAVLQMMGPCGHTSENVEWFTATSEVLLSYDPDVIFLEEWTGDEREYVARLIEEDGLLQALTAVQTDSLHIVPVNNLRFQNWIGLGRALDVIMPLAYPEVFPVPLTDEQVEEILTGAS